MKFGSWTYNGNQVDLKHLDQVQGSNLVPIGIDLSEFYLSVEWDVLEVPATRNEEYYPGYEEPFSDITFKLTMRRKTLFYTVNLIIPIVGITFMTVLVFYLPSDSGEKVSADYLSHAMPNDINFYKGYTLHLHSRLIDCLLLAPRRNYPSDIISHSVTRQISPIHDDASIAVCLDDCLHPESTLQV